MDPEDTEVDDILPVMMGGLSSADAMKSYQRQQGLVEAQMRSNMAALMKARDDLRAQRAGPGSAERLLAIAAALGQPTRTGSFGETLGNLGAVLGSQEKTKREAAAQNAALAEKYGMQIGNEQLRLLMQGQAGTGQMLRAALAREGKQRRTGFNPQTGELQYMDTGEPVKSATAAPSPEAINLLRTNPNLAKAFEEKYGAGTAAQYLGAR
jgi:hypothetical protein